MATGLEKVSFHSSPKERPCQRMLKLPHSCTNASNVMFKILQARLPQYVNHELQMYKLDLEKTEEPGIKFPTPVGSSNKQQNSRKMFLPALLTMPKPLTV